MIVLLDTLITAELERLGLIGTTQHNQDSTGERDRGH